MKTSTKTISLLASVALFTLSSLSAVQTAPVGYVTLTVKGSGTASEAFSFLSVPLLDAVSHSGDFEAVSGTILTDSDASWLTDAYNDLYFIEITSGANTGVSTTITDTTLTTLTTLDDLSSLIASDDTFIIRKYPTLAGVFGPSNEAGLQGGSSASNADTILIPDPLTQGFSVYYYKSSGLGSPGWFSTSSSGDKANTLLLPGTGFIVKRLGTLDVDVVVSGSVQVNNVFTPVEEDINFIASRFPTPVTLNQMFGVDGGDLTGGSSASNADTVLIPKESGGFDIYYYKSSGLGSPGWFSTSVSGTQGDTQIADVGGVVIVNRAFGTSFNLAEDITY